MSDAFINHFFHCNYTALPSQNLYRMCTVFIQYLYRIWHKYVCIIVLEIINSTYILNLSSCIYIKLLILKVRFQCVMFTYTTLNMIFVRISFWCRVSQLRQPISASATHWWFVIPSCASTYELLKCTKYW